MLRLTVLTDSVRAVRAASDTLSKLGLATSPLERVAHGCRAVAAADNVRVELREVSWLSELRRLRNAPRLGALVASGPDGSSPAPLALASSWLARHALLGETPAVLRDARLEASRTSKGLLREVVVSSSKLDAADAFFEVKRRVAQPKSMPPGVIRSGGVDWRVQPLSSSAAALVFRCSSVADTADQLRRAGVRFDHVTFWAFSGLVHGFLAGSPVHWISSGGGVGRRGATCRPLAQQVPTWNRQVTAGQ